MSNLNNNNPFENSYFMPNDITFRNFYGNSPMMTPQNVPKSSQSNNKKRKIDDIEDDDPMGEVFGDSWMPPTPNVPNTMSAMTEEELSALFHDFDPLRTPSQTQFPEFNIPSQIMHPEEPQHSGANDKLLEIVDFIERINSELESLYWDQKGLVLPPAKQEVERISTQHISLLQMVKKLQDELKFMLSQELLNPSQLYQHCNLQQELITLLTKLQLYQEELTYMSSNLNETRCFACLVINKQPFPKSVKQNTKSTSVPGEDPTVVQLIKAPKGDCQPISQVRAGLVYEDYQSKRGSFTITNDRQEMDDTGIARFTDLRFPQGTRLKMVRLQFVVEVQFVQFNGQMGKALLETREPSNPFIVMTNENQWESSEGILLKKDVFEGNVEVSWFTFANMLQIHYLRSTRQESSDPKRPLSKFDFEYIKKHMFENREMVTQKDFDRFWSWFGKVMHKIRHQKPFLYLWLQGLVYGFITKPDVEYLLKGQPVGTFIIRFSERRPGKVAIAYNKFDDKTRIVETKHYLVDLHDAKDSKTLPDFLRDNHLFTQLLKLKTSYSCSPDGLIEERIPKDTAMKDYYTKTTSDPVDGYEEDLY